MTSCGEALAKNPIDIHASQSEGRRRFITSVPATERFRSPSCTGSAPESVRMPLSAPASSSTSIASGCGENAAARCNGVHPTLNRASRSAPDRKHCATVSGSAALKNSALPQPWHWSSSIRAEQPVGRNRSSVSVPRRYRFHVFARFQANSPDASNCDLSAPASRRMSTIPGFLVNAAAQCSGVAPDASRVERAAP